MSISNEALEKLVREIESQAIMAQQQIGQAKQQIGSKQREMRMVRLTMNEISNLPAGSNVYEGVGKMYVSLSLSGKWMDSLTQVQVRGDAEGKLNAKLEGQVKQKEGEVDQLGKKLHYLETTFKNSREHIDKMLKSQGA